MVPRDPRGPSQSDWEVLSQSMGNRVVPRWPILILFMMRTIATKPDDAVSGSTESVQFAEEVLSEVKAFREELHVEEVEDPLPRLPRRSFVET